MAWGCKRTRDPCGWACQDNIFWWCDTCERGGDVPRCAEHNMALTWSALARGYEQVRPAGWMCEADPGHPIERAN